MPFVDVLQEALSAYADCNASHYRERNLTFKASEYVSVEEAIEIFEEALRPGGEYNHFTPALLLGLKALFDEPAVRVERVNSVAITVSGQTKGFVTPDLIERAMDADQVDIDDDSTWIWWD